MSRRISLRGVQGDTLNVGRLPMKRTIMRLAALLVLAMLPAVADAADWLQYRADAARSGYTADKLPTELALRWSYRPLQAPMPAWPDPGWERNRLAFDMADQVVIADGKVMFGSSADCTVRALDAATGKLIWQFLAGGPVRFAPAVWKDRLFVVSDDGHLYCLSVEDGNLLWKFFGGLYQQNIIGNGRMVSRWPARGGPVVVDDTVYFAAGIFPTQGAFVYALEAASGSVAWVNDTACVGFVNIGMPSGDSFTGVASQGYLVAQGDNLLVPTGRGLPGLFNRTDGALRYFGTMGSFQDGGTWVMASGDWFVCADKAYTTRTKTMYCADLGNLNRAFGTPGGHGRMAPVEARHMSRELALSPKWLVVANGTGTEVKLADAASPFTANASSGAASNRSGGPEQSARARTIAVTAMVPVPCHGAVIVADQTACVGGKDIVSTVDLTAQKVSWSARIEGTAYGLAAADGMLLVSTDSGMLYCFAAPGGGPVARVVQEVDGRALQPAGDEYAKAAQEILQQSGVTEGYCLDLGCGDGRLALELAKRTKLTIYAVDTDAAQVAAARQMLLAAGLYGTRVMVHQVDSLTATPAPNYFAELVVSGRSVTEGAAAAPAAEAMRAARPYGGIVLVGRPGGLQKSVRGPLEGAGRWTHQYADAANTLCSGDSLAKSPLGVLWFGSPGQGGLPHAWGRPPAPLVVDGRMFIQGIDFIRCMDVYNGRVLWETPLKGICRPYARAHYAGTYLVGANWCANSRSLFVHDRGQCYRLDAATGQIAKTFEVPSVEGVQGKRWGYIACTEDTLYATVDGEEFVPHGILEFTNTMKRSQGLAFVALDPASGQPRWSYRAADSIWHETIVMGGGRVYLVDRPADAQNGGGRLVALEAATGKAVWTNDSDIFGNCLVLSQEHDALLMAFPAPPGSPIRALRQDIVGDRMAVFRASTGQRLWDQPRPHALRPVVIGRMIISQGLDGEYLLNKRRSRNAPPSLPAGTSYQKPFWPDAYDLLTGEPVVRSHPLDGSEEPWFFGCIQRCGLMSAGENLLLYRTSDLTYYDLSRQQGTGNFGGYRPGCWINIIPAGGLVLAPDSWSACFCSHLNRTAVALEPVRVQEQWGIVHARKAQAGTIAHVGLNLGGPGDQRDANGILWLAMPRPYGGRSRLYNFPKALDPAGAVTITGGQRYRHHADLTKIEGSGEPWILANGLMGPATVRVDTHRMPKDTEYTLKLHFAEPDGLSSGERVFDVKINGRKVLSDLDVAREAGGSWTGIVKECKVSAAESLTIELAPKVGQPILSGVEVVPGGVP